MPKSKSRRKVVFPQTIKGASSLFRGGSTLLHMAVLFAAGGAWLVGYISFGGGGTLLALAAGGTLCGLVLGIAFTRALGGPGLNLMMSLVWPSLFLGAIIIVENAQIERLDAFSMGVALLWPALFSTVGCMLVWFTILGSSRADDWARQTHPPAFLEETENTPDAE